MRLTQYVLPSLAARLLLALPVLIAQPAAQAQLFDMLKDKATKAIQDQIQSKPAPPPSAPESSQPSKGSAPGSPPPSGPAAATTPQTFQAYQGYDFVPGDTILFEDNFESDEDGEFPVHWMQQDGQGAVNLFAGRKALTLTGGDDSQVSPAIKGTKYLGDSWTIDFDAYLGSAQDALAIFLNPDNKVRGPARFSYTDWVGKINFSTNNFNTFRIQTQPPDKTPEFDQQLPMPDPLRADSARNQWHHFAVAYREGRLKLYVDQFRIYSLQDLHIRPAALGISGGSRERPVVISNIRIANGAGIKVADKKFTDAKIVTHGINFDTDKATLKPESMGTLNMVAGVLKNNPDVRFDIQGHTDSSGNAAHNLTLSQQRADAVKQQLVTMGIDAARLTTKGVGDTKPIADNATLEGRANNRRVEFITQR